MATLCPGSHFGFEVGIERIEKLLGGEPSLLFADQNCQVLGHLAAFNGFDADFFQGVSKPNHVRGAIEFAAIFKPLAPRENRRDRIGRGRLALW